MRGAIPLALPLILGACRTAVVEPGEDTAPPADCLAPLIPGTTRQVEFSLIPGGLFAMGSPDEEEGRLEEEVWHEVFLSRDVCIQTTEVTRLQFFRLMGYQPEWADGCEDGDCPVEWVSWYEAAAFANALSDSLGLEGCYRCSGVDRWVRCAPPEDPYACRGYRIPTEAEWERAARGGSPASFANGGDLLSGTSDECDPELVLDNGHQLAELAWFCGNSEYRSHPVARLEPNDWGLFDVSGNVWEWTHDWYTDDLDNAVDPLGADIGTHRVARGGSWSVSPGGVRVASRAGGYPGGRYASLGFRLARTSRQQDDTGE